MIRWRAYHLKSSRIRSTTPHWPTSRARAAPGEPADVSGVSRPATRTSRDIPRRRGLSSGLRGAESIESLYRRQGTAQGQQAALLSGRQGKSPELVAREGKG